MSEPDTADPSAILLDCRYNQRLASDMAAVHALLAAAQIALVDFNHSSQPLTAGPDHSAAKLMQTRPCRLITAPAEHTLQRYRAYTVLLTDQQPHGAKPYSQWRSRILKHRARGHRNLIAATGALNTARLQGPTLASFASRTMESVRPSEIKQIPPASLLRAEAPLKLQKRTGIILFHAHEHYRLGLPESNGYPVHHESICDHRHRRTELTRHESSQQAAEWSHALECHGVIAHHAAALVFAHNGLNHR